ncbi:MAG: hypothetical protein RQ736_14960 [Thiogranum sp.]|nr:hypothetical protein [Thiogranum sp.]
MLEFPANNIEWEADVFEAVEVALEHIGARDDDELSPELENLYLHAPALAAQRRKINDQELIKEMEQHAIDGVKHDISLAPESKRFWLFHFVLAYVHSHVPIEIVDELAMDRVMDYINDRHDLFHT